MIMNSGFASVKIDSGDRMYSIYNPPMNNITYLLLQRGGCQWLTATVGKKRVGLCTFNCTETTCTLFTITIENRFRGKGYGRALFNTLLQSINVQFLKLVILGGTDNTSMMALIEGLLIEKSNDAEYTFNLIKN